jgi:hypothetical protein
MKRWSPSFARWPGNRRRDVPDVMHRGPTSGAVLLVLCIAGVAAACAAGPAAGSDRPALRPLRDVDVTYALDAGGGASLHERMRWDVESKRLRIEPPTAGLYVIIDFSARRMSTVRLAEQTVIEMMAPDNTAGVPNAAAAAAVRQGSDTVAGLACTEWDMTDAAGEAVRLCLTDDGVLLRARANGRTLLSAETVHYGPLDATLFEVPARYRREKMGPQPGSPQGASAQPAGPQ